MASSGYRLKVIATVINLHLLLLMAVIARADWAEDVYDPEAYRQLADASSAQTIPLRTTITYGNWTAYRRFIPVGMQNAFSAKYQIRPGPEPLYTIEISPTEHFGQPRKFVEDTEKYLGQTQLVQSPTGGFGLSPLPGNTAGLPFGPDPGEPNLAYKVVYNYWLAYQPRISNAISSTWAIDSYRNAGQHSTNITAYRLSHLSEPGLPPALPFAQGYLSSQRNVVLSPEQRKYNTSLKLWYDDPAKVPEVYSFIPSERRSLRLSAASRCRPMGTTDFVEDDSGFQIPNFKMILLGVKRIIARIQDPLKGFDPDAYDLTGAFPGWPKPGTGTWQLRDVYVVDTSPLPVLGSYCYSHKILYIDKETWIPLFNEAYEQSGKFWKLFWPKYAPVRIGDATTLTAPAGLASGEMLDFRRNHASVSIQYGITVGEKVPHDYPDTQQLASRPVFIRSTNNSCRSLQIRPKPEGTIGGMDVREVNSPGNRAIRQSERCTKDQLELIQLLVEQAYRDGELVLSGLFEESPWFRFQCMARFESRSVRPPEHAGPVAQRYSGTSAPAQVSSPIAGAIAF